MFTDSVYYFYFSPISSLHSSFRCVLREPWNSSVLFFPSDFVPLTSWRIQIHFWIWSFLASSIFLLARERIIVFCCCFSSATTLLKYPFYPFKIEWNSTGIRIIIFFHYFRLFFQVTCEIALTRFEASPRLIQILRDLISGILAAIDQYLPPIQLKHFALDFHWPAGILACFSDHPELSLRDSFLPSIDLSPPISLLISRQIGPN